MIKLTKILSEIKIRGKITPKQIYDLWNEKVLTLPLKFEERSSIRNKYRKHNKTLYSTLLDGDLSQTELNQLYQDILDLLEQNNISEIKINPSKKYTSDEIISLLGSLLTAANESTEADEIFNHIRNLYVEYFGPNTYRIDIENIEELNQHRKNSLYLELINIKNLYNLGKIEEIKIHGDINPKIVLKLWLDIVTLSEGNENLSDEVIKIKYKYKYKNETLTYTISRNLLSKEKLIELYKELLDILNKYKN